jgi:eukaryotic-like serine/threonine-protein kinase
MVVAHSVDSGLTRYGLGTYIIHECLGMGRMGWVYRAEDVKQARYFALQVLDPDYTHIRRDVSAYLDDAMTASALRHPNIVHVDGCGVLEDGRMFVVMQLLHGRSLTRRLKEGPIGLRELLWIAMQICHALDSAHRAGIVHGHVNPNCIFLEDDFFDGDRATLLDFGIARLWRRSKPPASLVRSRYRAPESLSGPYDTRSDIYSMGVLLARMAGKPSGVPWRLRKAIKRCLMPNPRDRFEYVKELKRALGDVRAAMKG